LIIGAALLAEGMQKLLSPAVQGVGRIEKIGFPDPEFLSLFFEFVCAALLLTTRRRVPQNPFF
jgi:uncharacterized membrane protein YphA (DoxX/SURF4 family)